MTSISIHRTIAVFTNLLLIVLLLWLASAGNSDKSVILVSFYFAVLLLANLVIRLTLKKLKSAHSVIYKQTSAGLAVLFLPVVFLAARL